MFELGAHHNVIDTDIRATQEPIDTLLSLRRRRSEEKCDRVPWSYIISQLCAKYRFTLCDWDLWTFGQSRGQLFIICRHCVSCMNNYVWFWKELMSVFSRITQWKRVFFSFNSLNSCCFKSYWRYSFVITVLFNFVLLILISIIYIVYIISIINDELKNVLITILSFLSLIGCMHVEWNKCEILVFKNLGFCKL